MNWQLLLIGNLKQLTTHYFTVTYTAGGDFTFTAQSGTTNPAADVPSTLKITLEDCFGHKNEYSLPFTVKRAQ